MADDNRMAGAESVYAFLCAALDKREWKYEKDEEKLSVSFGLQGDDIPMRFRISVDAGRRLIRLLSWMPFDVAEDKRVEFAPAVCAASYGLADGSFDYDISDGSIYFRMTASFRESEIGEELLQYMIDCAAYTVDKYNDQFFALNKGIVSLEDFIEKVSE